MSARSEPSASSKNAIHSSVPSGCRWIKCGAPLPQELLYTAEEKAALDAEYERSAQRRADEARRDRGGDSDVLLDASFGDGGGD